MIRIACPQRTHNRFGAAAAAVAAAAATLGILSGNEHTGVARRKRRRRGQARGEGREINFVVPWMFAARAVRRPANELPRVKSERASRCGLRYRADYHGGALE